MTIIAILTILGLYVTAVYGPIAAALVEFFPTRIRYSGLSLPYHIGNGWFGGLLPATAFAMVAATGDIYFGLWNPVGIALMTVVIGVFFVPETYKREIFKHSIGRKTNLAPFAQGCTRKRGEIICFSLTYAPYPLPVNSYRGGLPAVRKTGQPDRTPTMP